MNPSWRRWWRYPQAERLINRYLALEPREQILLQLTVHTLLLMSVLVLVVEPLWLQVRSDQVAVTAARQETRQLQQQWQIVQQQVQPDPDEPLRQQLQQLAAEQQVLDQRIASLTDALVSPAQMVPVLKALLQQDPRLQLLSLTTLPRETLTLNDDSPAVLYRHGLRLQLKATYAGLQAYQQRLDALPWRVYWQTLEYQVQEYPYADVRIELYTLSMSGEVLGG